MLALQGIALAQSTRVKGRVVDSETGEGIPFAGLFFKNTYIGVSSDLDGYYSLETKDENAKVLSAQILGYESQEVTVKANAYNEINFTLKPIYSSLNSVTIKADDHKVRRLLNRINENKERNNPDLRPSYECDTYTKMELDLVEADKFLTGKKLRKNFDFVFDYMDTSVVNGMSYLPTMITETIAHNYHQISPGVDREEIIANRVSGIDNTPTIAQFTGSMHAKTNLYDNFLDIFDVQIPSPISNSGTTYYNYYLIDSLDIAGRKTYKVRFHPKYVSSPVFDGEFNVDAEDYAIQEAHVKLRREATVNWVKNMVIDIENQRGDSLWFYKHEKLYVEFSPDKKDSTKIMTFFGTRQIDYTNPVYNKPIKESIQKANNNVLSKRNVVINDDRFWQAARPSPLTEKEQGIYNMVDSVKAVPAFNGLYNFAQAFTNGFYDFDKLAFGPYYKVVSFNTLEGTRLQVGGRTTFKFSKTNRYTAYVGYGTRDHNLKGSFTLEHMYSNDPFRKLTITAKQDVRQMGRSEDAFVEGNIMSSIMSKGNSDKLSPIREYSAVYEHEVNPRFTNTFALEFKRILSNDFVPMITPQGDPIKSVGTNQLRYTARFSWDEIVTRGPFERYFMYSDYPIITLNMQGSVKGLGENTYSYFRPEVIVNYRFNIPPLGLSKITFNAGKIFGQVPYPLLKLHEGNGSYYYDPGAFACMDFYEFASDEWMTLFYTHNFKGFFLGKVPLIRKLGWRENIMLKAAYGTLSDKNNGTFTLGSQSKAPLLFPEGMSSLEKPYVEVGVGVNNIFQLFRVDAYRRLTHLRDDGKNFAINIGMEFQF